MTALFFALQILFARPITNAYAAQVKSDVIVSVTYADIRPTKVCTAMYAMDDTEFRRPLDTHCWTPTSDIGSLDVWEHTRIDDGNFKVIVVYPGRADDTIYLVIKVNT